MPTESTFLLAGLFFFAAALGYYFARSADADAGNTPAGKLSADYIKGLNFLLNEKPDQALEVFMRMAEVDDETLETHFALGSLFRRRGEIERAIRVHENIVARPNLSLAHHEQALVGLAEDYLSAGLFDRAESLFEELRESEEHGVYVRRKLVRIYEVTSEWELAIKGFSDLERIDPRAAEESRVAHYYCELAEQAIGEGDLESARRLLNKSENSGRVTVRSALLLADMSRGEGEHANAIASYLEIMERESRLIGEVVPKLAESCRASGEQGQLSQRLQKFRDADAAAGKAIALAAVYDSRIVNEAALACLREYVLADKVLAGLVDMTALQEGNAETSKKALLRIRDGLTSVVSQSHRYRCRQCGYISSELLWHCPSCRSWESVSPSVELNFSSFV
jgi:lipopolysaccharide biosynthesis regulator YciM